MVSVSEILGLDSWTMCIIMCNWNRSHLDPVNILKTRCRSLLSGWHETQIFRSCDKLIPLLENYIPNTLQSYARRLHCL